MTTTQPTCACCGQIMFRCSCGATYDTESAAKACLRRNHEPVPTDIGNEESK